ncbi:MAG: hypothetical protein AB1637_02290 [Elusimicrobiota bacterium]
MKKIIFILMIAVQAGFSYDFENITMAEIRAGAENFKAPVPQNPVTEDDEITADLSMRVPFAAVKKLFVSMSASDGRIKLIDDVAPILYSDGKTLTVKNLKLNINGIMAEPVLSLKPYMEAKNKMALKIEKVKFHVLMLPDRSRAASNSQFQIEDAMDQVMSILISEINKTLDDKFKKDGLPLKAKDVVSMKYYKNEWILRASVSGKFVNAYVPASILSEPYLAGFSFDSGAFYVKIKSGK